jgi:hypothetical protein
MPLKHMRICAHCNVWRWAPCSVACRVPDEQDQRSWMETVDGVVVYVKEAS